MPFVNSYGFQGQGGFRRSIPAAEDSVLALGGYQRYGLVSRITPDGQVVWSRLYGFEGTAVGLPGQAGELVFLDGVEAEDGYFLLAAWGRPPAYDLLVVLRIDTTGDVVFARAPDAQVDLGARILRCAGSQGDALVVTGSTRTAADYDSSVARLIRINANGATGKVVDVSLPDQQGGRLFDAVPTPDGSLLVGDAHETRSSSQWMTADREGDLDAVGQAGLVVDLDTELGLNHAWLLEDPRGQVSFSPRAVLRRAGGGFTMTGCAVAGGSRLTFVADFTITGGALVIGQCSLLDLSQGGDRPYAMVATSAGTFVLDRLGPLASSSRVLRLNAALQPLSLHGFTFDVATQVHGLSTLDDGSITIVGTGGPADGGAAVMLSVPPTFDCCRTVAQPVPSVQKPAIVVQPAKLRLVEVLPKTTVVSVASSPVPLDIQPLCGAAVDHWGAATLVQSPYLNLQAAGSTGVDASRGVLLRWFLAGSVGKAHLPKGNLANPFPVVGFNRPDDVVILRRAKWPANPTVRTLSFATAHPAYVDGAERIMAFKVGTGLQETQILVHFADAAAFAAAGGPMIAQLNPTGFMASYGAHPIEIELCGALAIACDLTFQPNAGCAIRLEVRSVGENTPLADRHVTVRAILGAADGPRKRVLAENLRSIRLECTGTQISEAAFICYDDLLGQMNLDHSWFELGRFALSDQQYEVFRRLEDQTRFTVHGQWGRFNDGALVNVANYRDRWTDPDGLAAAVQTYVQLSNTNPQAVGPLNGAGPYDPPISISYLDMLQIAAVDYHVARMLGLGHIDTGPVDPLEPYLYIIEYRTQADLGDGMGPRDVQHLYMSLPTSLSDSRLPAPPDLPPPEYGLSVPTGSGAPHWLTDAQGYTPDGLNRYIRLYPGSAALYGQEVGFFDPPDLFDLSRTSLPTCYGVEHRLQGAAAWDRTEVANEPDYLDTAGYAETLPSPFPATQRASPFVHRQTQSGVHEYAAYVVNLFFRGSALGPVQACDPTVIRRANRLLPPSDLHVQLIQKESPLVLTTDDEQHKLDDLLALHGDPTLARLCFNYGFSQDAAYDYADAVEIFFRQQAPRNVRGGILSIGPDSDPSMLRIATRPFTYANGDIISPIILQNDRDRFLGGALVAGSQRFVIESISWPNSATGADPVFLVRKPTTTGVVHTAGPAGTPGMDTLVVQDAPINAHPGDLIMAIENMAEAANWDGPNPLAATVTIGDSTWTDRVETFTRNGVTTSRRLRGVWSSAKVDLDPTTGLYSVIFDSYVLNAHPQHAAAAKVDWWKGTVRLPVQGLHAEDRRPLKVLKILTSSAGKLALLAQDDSGEPGPVIAAAGQLVNFYPGYRVYLGVDSAHGFDSSTVMPAAGQGSRMTLIGARSRDVTGVDSSGQPYNYRSSIGVPAILTALELVEPGVPGKPSGLLFATPPDRYGTSSYSLTVAFPGHTPFAVAFYRADAFSILRALYEPATAATIIGWLFPPKPGSWFVDQLRDLLAFIEDGPQATPAAFVMPDGSSKALPFPDNAALGAVTSMALAEAKKKMRKAVVAAFVGLTEQPLPYTHIKSGHTPHNGKQKIRDSNGDLLKPPDLDLAPMACRLADGSVQFVDFTLGGAMNPNTVYFYFARELGNRMKLGEPGPIWGPVALVNLAASSAPALRRIKSVLADETSGAGPKVEFELLAPSATDPVTKLRIHRCLDARDALSIRTMPQVAEMAIAGLTLTGEGGLLAADNFASGDLPYGRPLYYRLVWVREVAYADVNLAPQTAQSISEPTRTLLANIVDTAAPKAPVPVASIVTPGGGGASFIRLTWTGTVHNGTYYVCQLDPSGNWFRVGVVASDDPLTFDLPDTLPPMTEDGDPIYYRFKIDVQSSGGRMNLRDEPVTVDLTSP